MLLSVVRIFFLGTISTGLTLVELRRQYTATPGGKSKLGENLVPEWSRRKKRCGAKKKHLRGAEKGEGFYCREWALAGSNRCKWHGGASTGQRTAEGKARALAARNAARSAKALALRAEGKEIERGPAWRVRPCRRE